MGVALAVRDTVRVPVFEAGTETLPWVVTSLPSPLYGALAIAVCGAIGVLVGNRPWARALAPLWALVLSAAIFVPGLFRLAPFVALFSGRILDLVLVGALLACGWRLLRGSTTPFGFDARARTVGVAAFVLFVAVGLELSRDVGLSGDEPHYLLITHSALFDHDLRVQNNYFDEDHRFFYRGKIGPHLAEGSEYSIHGVGLPILLVPGYGLGGLTGVVISLALLGALIVGALFEATRRATESSEIALMTSTLFALTSPTLFLSIAAYPELPAAVIVMVTFLRLQRGVEHSLDGAILPLLAGSLPFFHMKFIPLMFVLWAALWLRLRSRRGLVVGILCSCLAIVTFFYVTTGSVDPTASYGRQRVFVSSIPTGLAGLLFDQEFGLLIMAPFYLIGITGMVAMIRRAPFLGLSAAAVLAAVALPGAAHPLWSGGNSPPARFLFPALPLVALAAAIAWRWERPIGVTRWLPSLAVLSVCFSAFCLRLPGQPLYLNQKDGSGRLWEALSSSWDLSAYLPSVVAGDARSLAWVVIAALVVVASVALQIRNRPTKLPPVVAVVIGFLWIQDLTGVVPARAQEGRWISGLMRRQADVPGESYLAVPRFERLSSRETMERAPLELSSLEVTADDWWSRAYALPAGRYRVAGVSAGSWEGCSNGTCFPSEADDTHFDSTVALSRFQLRARPPAERPMLWLESAARGRLALRSLRLPDGRRLHGLDDEAYLDRGGFWVKSSSRASFVLEPGGSLRFTNGGADNRVVVESPEERWQLDLKPYEQNVLPIGSGAFLVESGSGFRPSDLNSESDDDRELGVFIDAPGL